MHRLAALALIVTLAAAPTLAEDEPAPSAPEPLTIEFPTFTGAAALPVDGLPAGLVDEGRSLLGVGGRAALLRTRRVVGGAPRKEAVRTWAARFRATDDLGEAWALAQAIRFADHVHFGSIWTHDDAAQHLVAAVANDATQPWKAALAAECLGDRGRMRELLLDAAADPLLRAFGAANLGPPAGVSESAAREVLLPLLDLLRHDTADVRAMAAVRAADWCVTLEDQQQVLDLARSESNPIALAALLRSIRAFGVPTARSLFAEIAADETRPGPVREAARSARRGLAIRPNG